MPYATAALHEARVMTGNKRLQVTCLPPSYPAPVGFAAANTRLAIHLFDAARGEATEQADNGLTWNIVRLFTGTALYSWTDPYGTTHHHVFHARQQSAKRLTAHFETCKRTWRIMAKMDVPYGLAVAAIRGAGFQYATPAIHLARWLSQPTTNKPRPTPARLLTLADNYSFGHLRSLLAGTPFVQLTDDGLEHTVRGAVHYIEACG